jgi:predicted amidohydrolase
MKHYVASSKLRGFYQYLGVRSNLKVLEIEVWKASVEIHDHWISRLPELTPAIVLSSRTVIKNGRRLNEAFVWDDTAGYKAVHHKYYLPDEEGWWEASWYERREKDFTVIETVEGE